MAALGPNWYCLIYSAPPFKVTTPFFPELINETSIDFKYIFYQTLISTLVILITAEFLPKVFFQIYANRLFKLFSFPAFIFYYLFSPLTFVFNSISDSFLNLLLNLMLAYSIASMKSILLNLAKLNKVKITSPNSSYPAYTTESVSLDVFPEDVTSIGRVKCQYIRYPKDPKWTYVQLVGGEPSFDSSSALYQDFEIPLEDEPTLVNKILQYAGMSIRETQVTQFATGLNTIETQNEK